MSLLCPEPIRIPVTISHEDSAMRRSHRGRHVLGMLAGLILIGAPAARAQCRAAGGPPSSGPAANLGVRVTATPTSTLVQWSQAPACGFTVTWWSQSVATAPLGSASAGTGTSWTIGQLAPGMYVVRVTMRYPPDAYQHEDQAFQVPIRGVPGPITRGPLGVVPQTAAAGAVPCDDANPATDDVVTNGVCMHTNKPVGAPCSPPAGGQADGMGRCLAAPACDDANPATDDVVINGVCVHNNKPVGAPCSPPAGGKADGMGRCLAAPACDDANPATDDVVINGVCVHTNKPVGAPCSPPAGGKADGMGRCLAAPACDDANPATDDVVTNGVCMHTNKPVGAPCSPPAGGQADGMGRCLAAPACDDANPATDDVVINGVCVHTNKPVGAPCSPPAGGKADGMGRCLAAPACDDANPATDDVVINGVCVHTNKPVGAPCSPPAGGKADGMGHCVAPAGGSQRGPGMAVLRSDAPEVERHGSALQIVRTEDAIHDELSAANGQLDRGP